MWPLWPGHRRGLLLQASLIGFYAHETVTTPSNYWVQWCGWSDWHEPASGGAPVYKAENGGSPWNGIALVVGGGSTAQTRAIGIRPKFCGHLISDHPVYWALGDRLLEPPGVRR